jgi:hypothetical protein
MLSKPVSGIETRLVQAFLSLSPAREHAATLDTYKA